MKKLTTNEFLERANKKHNSKYDYSKVDYTSYEESIIIICPIHGQFSKTVANHLKGQGCMVCSTKNRMDLWKDNEIQFIKNNYKEKGSLFCANELNRTPRAIKMQATKLKLRRPFKSRPQHPYIMSAVFANLLRGAEERNLVVEISMDDIYNLFLKQNKKCALTGWDIDFSKEWILNTASVDRIDSDKGYTKDNIQIVHKVVNKCKTDLFQEDFIQMCKAVAQKAV